MLAGFIIFGPWWFVLIGMVTYVAYEYWSNHRSSSSEVKPNEPVAVVRRPAANRRSTDNDQMITFLMVCFLCLILGLVLWAKSRADYAAKYEPSADEKNFGLNLTEENREALYRQEMADYYKKYGPDQPESGRVQTSKATPPKTVQDTIIQFNEIYLKRLKLEKQLQGTVGWNKKRVQDQLDDNLIQLMEINLETMDR